jgi:hypothetical protein
MNTVDNSWESEEFNPDTNFGVMNADELRKELRKAVWVIEERLPAFESANAELFDSLKRYEARIKELEAEAVELERKVAWLQSIGVVKTAEQIARVMVESGEWK